MGRCCCHKIELKISHIQSSAKFFLFRFHPGCINMNAEEAKRLDHFFCENCSSEGQKKLQNSHATSRHADTKVFSFNEISEFDSIHLLVLGMCERKMYMLKLKWIC